MIARARAVVLVATLVAQLVLVPAAEAGDRQTVWFPFGAGVEASIFTKATTSDPFDLRTSGPTSMQLAGISVRPGGTSGLLPRPGITLTMVAEGVATVISGEAETCAGRAVAQGFALIEAEGGGTEIRNEGHSPLYVYTVTFTPADAPPAAMAARSCPATPQRHAVVRTLNRAVIEAPLSVESKDLSDVYLGAVRLAPQGVLGWHVQHRPLLAGVGEGNVTLDLASGEGCTTGVFPAQTGFLEPARTVHALRNTTNRPAMYYYLAFAATPQPFLAPSVPPRTCPAS